MNTQRIDMWANLILANVWIASIPGSTVWGKVVFPCVFAMAWLVATFFIASQPEE